MSQSPAPRTSRLAAAFNWFVRDQETGRIVMWQWPNLSIGIFLVATAITWLTHPSGGWALALRVIATVALLWWAGDELVRGSSPFRRTLGAVVATWTVAGLVADALS